MTTSQASLHTHRPLDMAGVCWVEDGRRATCGAARPGYAVQVVATGEVLSRDGVSPAIWRTKAIAQVIADNPMDWPTLAVQLSASRP